MVFVSGGGQKNDGLPHCGNFQCGAQLTRGSWGTAQRGHLHLLEVTGTSGPVAPCQRTSLT